MALKMLYTYIPNQKWDTMRIKKIERIKDIKNIYFALY